MSCPTLKLLLICTVPTYSHCPKTSVDLSSLTRASFPILTDGFILFLQRLTRAEGKPEYSSSYYSLLFSPYSENLENSRSNECCLDEFQSASVAFLSRRQLRRNTRVDHHVHFRMRLLPMYEAPGDTARRRGQSPSIDIIII